MKAETIKAIFTNVLFVIGVILLIFGFITGTQTAVKLATFDQYPLNSYEESRCEAEMFPTKIALDGTSVPLTASESAERREKCLTGVEFDRRVRKTEDIVGSVTTLVAGAVLVFSFRRFIFRD